MAVIGTLVPFTIIGRGSTDNATASEFIQNPTSRSLVFTPRNNLLECHPSDGKNHVPLEFRPVFKFDCIAQPVRRMYKEFAGVPGIAAGISLSARSA
jgi:hypothetical protein